eukprot:3147525-Prymnesium_polylepis.1
MEMRLQQRRLLDIIEAMRSRKAVDVVQKVGRRWVAQHRAARALQAQLAAEKDAEQATGDPPTDKPADGGEGGEGGAEDEKAARAAATLQARQRGVIARKQHEAEERAATQVQANVRGHQQRVATSHQREVENAAASK